MAPRAPRTTEDGISHEQRDDKAEVEGHLRVKDPVDKAAEPVERAGLVEDDGDDVEGHRFAGPEKVADLKKQA